MEYNCYSLQIESTLIQDTAAMFFLLSTVLLSLCTPIRGSCQKQK